MRACATCTRNTPWWRRYQCRLEPEGSLLIPPDFNVGVTDWERASRLRQGVFAVLDSEPPRHASSSSSAAPRGWGAGGHPPAQQAPGAPLHGGPLSSVSPARPGGPASSSMAKYHPSFSGERATSAACGLPPRSLAVFRSGVGCEGASRRLAVHTCWEQEGRKQAAGVQSGLGVCACVLRLLCMQTTSWRTSATC